MLLELLLLLLCDGGRRIRRFLDEFREGSGRRGRLHDRLLPVLRSLLTKRLAKHLSRSLCRVEHRRDGWVVEQRRHQRSLSGSVLLGLLW